MPGGHLHSLFGKTSPQTLCSLFNQAGFFDAVQARTAFLSFFSFFFFCLFAISWIAPTAYGGSQARGPIGAVAASLHQSHSNSGSEPSLQPTPQLTAMPDP